MPFFLNNQIFAEENSLEPYLQTLALLVIVGEEEVCGLDGDGLDMILEIFLCTAGLEKGDGQVVDHGRVGVSVGEVVSDGS